MLLLSFVTYTAQVFQGFEVTVGDGDDGLEGGGGRPERVNVQSSARKEGSAAVERVIDLKAHLPGPRDAPHQLRRVVESRFARRGRKQRKADKQNRCFYLHFKVLNSFFG